MGTGKLMILVPLFDLKSVPGSNLPRTVQGLQIGGARTPRGRPPRHAEIDEPGPGAALS